MELKEGMLLRTKKGTLHNINEISKSTGRPIEYHFDSEEDIKNNNIGWKKPIQLEDISKASHNIIDLIEVGDYVNGELVVAIHEHYVCDEIELGTALETACNYTATLNEDIKSIVTKEQFESMSYKVGD